MPVIDELRRNDPRVTSVSFRLFEDFSDADHTEALQQNPHITDIRLWIYSALWNWPILLSHLETRNNLHHVALLLNQDCGASFEIILQTLERNTNVREFRCSGIPVAVQTLASFLNAATQITKLVMNAPLRNGNITIGGPALLSASILGMPYLQYLTLGNIQPEYLVAIFDTLRHKKSLQTLNVRESKLLSSPAAMASFQKLMRTTSMIRELVISCFEPFESRGIILEIARRNFSLRDVATAHHPLGQNDLSGDEDQRLLQFFANRNERMDEWMEHPADSVPKHLWPNVLHVASRGGDPSVLFRSLIAISGDLAPSKRTRKRRPPTYYAPS